ncbi:LysR family transcriptional regulator [Echinimonas agarilytica]|uniref:LysR family transcriptional regulator n=1 Tax=Echinimonas agarilytica TaxID=1215918 RepID=A0AA41W3J7_9GAMM|nr:LysR family transcriptional regulator [Echinimonas agarilytica]MCM2678154.1 LysR family transcriptional regulator [Echinimonas agarilytica]
MDLNNLNVFIALFETGSTQRAALQLGRSQSYVSKTLAQLREDLDDSLFIRSANGLEPTTYAKRIAPKLKLAIASVESAIEPDQFSPSSIDTINIHVSEPLILAFGKPIIEAIRAETTAKITLVHWRSDSEQSILEGGVEIGIHAITDRSQEFYQRKIFTATAVQRGKQGAEMIKVHVDNFNEFSPVYERETGKIEPTIVTDNTGLGLQLEDQYNRYHLKLATADTSSHLNFDVGYVIKSSRREEPKIQWISKIIDDVIKNNTHRL